jgi:hypothetical protein
LVPDINIVDMDVGAVGIVGTFGGASSIDGNVLLICDSVPSVHNGGASFDHACVVILIYDNVLPFGDGNCSADNGPSRHLLSYER